MQRTHKKTALKMSIAYVQNTRKRHGTNKS